MGPSSDRQPASRVVEEPKRSPFPYVAAAVIAAVAVWSFQQQDNAGPARPETDVPKPVPSPRQTPGSGASRGDLRTLFSADDYPAEAQLKGEEGTVRVELTVNPLGRVSGCRVIRSSGSAALDRATCNILQRRARFTPARDANGSAVTDTVLSPPVVWRLVG